MTPAEWITLIAILVGPVAAVIVARILDEKRATRERRMMIFREMMRTRRLRLSPEAVGAFNLVEIEFQKSQRVIERWKDLLTHFSGAYPKDATLEALHEANKKADVLYAKLLHAMALELKFPVQQFDIIEGGYAPQGWEDDESAQRALRIALLNVLSGNRALRVVPGEAPRTAHPSPFPPRPSEFQKMAQGTETE